MRDRQPRLPAVARAAIVRDVQRDLRRHVNPERRRFLEGGYAASRMRILGVAVPDLRRAIRAAGRELRDATPGDVLAVATALIDDGTMEGRQAGYELIALRRDVLPLLSAARLRRLGRGNDNWASVDAFATLVAGRVWLTGAIDDETVLGWARSRDRWWRRTALASTVVLNVPARGGTGDARRTLRVCGVLVGERDPMLAKALSWAIRSLVPRAPDDVRRFLARHERTLPATVRREVRTKLETGRKHG